MGKEPLEEIKMYIYYKYRNEKNSPVLTLYHCLNKFTEVEAMVGDNKLYCPTCKNHEDGKIKYSLWELPNILIIHISLKITR